MVESAIVVGLAYLMGAFPTAYILGRLFKGTDIRDHGSRNPGALNAYRQLGRPAGLFVMVADTGKGALAVLIGQQVGVPHVALYAVAVAATLGHNFSPFLRFRGGKGGATVLGISALLLWQITPVTVLFGVVVLAITRHAVWSMTAVFVLLNLLTIATSQPPGQIAVCLVLSLIVAGTHALRQYPQVAPAIRQRQWRRFMRIE